MLTHTGTHPPTGRPTRAPQQSTKHQGDAVAARERHSLAGKGRTVTSVHSGPPEVTPTGRRLRAAWGDFLEEVTVSQNLSSQQVHEGRKQPEPEWRLGAGRRSPPGVGAGHGQGRGVGKGGRGRRQPQCWPELQGCRPAKLKALGARRNVSGAPRVDSGESGCQGLDQGGRFRGGGRGVGRRGGQGGARPGEAREQKGQPGAAAGGPRPS